MSRKAQGPESGRVRLDGLEATAALAARLAAVAAPGDVLCLGGGLGVGKTTFARFFLRALGVVEEVPSPTFNLVLVYETDRGPVWHFDLYRIEAPEEVLELGLEDALADGISLIEWPERLGPFLPADRLDLEFSLGGLAETRILKYAARGAAAARFAGALAGLR